MTETAERARPRITLPALAPERLRGVADALVIDLRSPSEFAEDHVPGAFNLPLFDDVERALIGTLYRQHSPRAAFDAGERIVRDHIAGLVARIGELAGGALSSHGIEREVDLLCARGLEGLATSLDEAPATELSARPIVFHCWRGGLRSRSVVALVRRLGCDRALLLSGGYKAWRRAQVEELARWRAPATFVLRGWTGVGKTLVLREIEALRPGWTLDLEGLAGHRSSLLGMVGLEPCTQKTFESRVAERLREIEAVRLREVESVRSRDTGAPRPRELAPQRESCAPLVLEGESRKVGDAILPPSVWQALDLGTNLELVAGTRRRIDVLAADYLSHPKAREQLVRQLPRVEARMSRAPGAEPLVALLERGAIDELVAILLESYYDPLYRHSERGRRYAARFDAENPSRAAREIVRFIDGEITLAAGAG